MNKSLIIAVAAASLIALSGCQTQEAKPAKSAAQVSYEAALAKAKSAQKAAKAAKNEWRDTGKFIKKAEGMAAKGDYAGATKLAAKAEAQGHDAVAQAKDQAGAGNPGYLY
jgi:hypothetical protein